MLTSLLSVRLLQIENSSRATLISPSHPISIRPIVRSLCIKFSVTWAWRTSVDDECFLVLTIQGSWTSGQHMYHNFQAKHCRSLLIIKYAEASFSLQPSLPLSLSLSLCLCSEQQPQQWKNGSLDATVSCLIEVGWVQYPFVLLYLQTRTAELYIKEQPKHFFCHFTGTVSHQCLLVIK